MLFEGLGYLAAAIVYVRLRARRGDAIGDTLRLDIIAGAAVGAALGSRLLAALAQPPVTLISIMSGKTILGGLLGGWIGVELVKKLMRITTRTGDLFVLPLIVAMSIGRIGCFLAGPGDHTAGIPSNLPWAIAIRDGVPRHPVALYEIAFLIALGTVVEVVRWRGRDGDAFRAFIAGYGAFRFAIDFLKPDPPPIVARVTLLQIAALGMAATAVLSWCGADFSLRPGRRTETRPAPEHAR
jgi:phosphatidylglycerol:prolipoprotein diacylglycerol transferase